MLIVYSLFIYNLLNGLGSSTIFVLHHQYLSYLRTIFFFFLFGMFCYSPHLLLCQLWQVATQLTIDFITQFLISIVFVRPFTLGKKQFILNFVR
jgi:hypothetical protein